jgi:Kef-type K+ transport system membrane component KefB
MHGHNPILILLLQVVLILALSRVMGTLFRFFRQPQVMGEMVAGIMLGPSLFGWLAPGVAAWVFPAQSVTYLSVLSQVGVIFFLFLVGLELDPKLLRNRGHTAIVVSHVSIIAPFLLGAAAALYLYPRLFNNAPYMRFSSVALFLGAAMSITAFPVLARILTERNLHKTNIGAIAITCAAVDDVTAWCMLAFVVGIARARGLVPGLETAALSVAYVAFMFFLIKPFLHRLQAVHNRQGRLTQGVVATIFLLVLASAWTTEAIGIHALFGAFLMGAIMPKGTEFVRSLSEKLEDYTVIFLLPIFFAYTGLRTQIGLLDRPELWFDTALITLVACAGKFGGSALAGRACGLGWREASVIGILMNTRGLMELVILNIGLQEGVITPAVFAMMVIMALVTTALTTPVLHWIYPMRLLRAEAREAERARAFSVLVPVAMPESGAALARLAATLIDPSDGKILALHLQRPVDHEAYRSGLDEAQSPANDPALAPLLDEAREQKVATEPIAFVTRDAAADIAAVAAAQHAGLVVMGFHKPVFSKTILGGTVHRVMSQCETDVAVFVDRGFESARRILVPYMGSSHDRLALELAGRIARNKGASVTVLHIVPPSRKKPPLDAKKIVDRTFTDPALAAKVTLRVVEERSPVNVVVRDAADQDLVIIGVSEEWGLESHLFGWRPQRIARDCPTSMMIVRKYQAAPVASEASEGERLVPSPSGRGLA